MNYSKFTKDIIRWYEVNKRDLPWRDTDNPYFIWLSEIILQQTRVAQGLPYYLRFIDEYPTITQLAYAEENEVLRLWQGLGYYSRARNMLKTARFIIDELNGQFPTSYKEILKLKGVGKYTAGAIASFAFKERVPVVDGNVYRVLSRIFGVFEDISSGKGQQKFIDLAEQLLPQDRIDTYNQAIMEFGATVCLPKKPYCEDCIFNKTCYAYAREMVFALPMKSKKLVKKVREFTYFVIKHNNMVLMQKRREKDIWEGLFEFYLKEGHYTKLDEYFPDTTLSAIKKHIKSVSGPSETTSHILTHQIIKAHFWEIELEKSFETEPEFDHKNFFSLTEIAGLPKSVLIIKYLNKNYF